MKREMKENLVSAVLGIAIAIPLVIFATNHTEPAVKKQKKVENAVIVEIPTTTLMKEIESTEEETTVAVVETVTIDEESCNPLFTNENVELLAHLIGGEAGSDWCDDEMLYLTGSVVLNRVNSKDFPDSIYEVIYQEGQYKCTWDGNFERQPSDRCYYIAESLLQNGTTAPSNLLYQAQFIQGTVYKQVQNMYFCLGKE